MNDSRRRHLKDALEIITRELEAERESLGRVPISLRSSPKAEAMNEDCDRMQDARDALEEIVG